MFLSLQSCGHSSRFRLLLCPSRTAQGGFDFVHYIKCCTINRQSRCVQLVILSPLFILQNKSLLGKPVAVQQHQDIISVSYEARLKGVKKKMTPSQALSVCADLHLGFLLSHSCECFLSHSLSITDYVLQHMHVVHVRKLASTSKVTYQDYQEASSQIHALMKDTLNVIQKQRRKESESKEELWAIEKASIDDFFIDVTQLLDSHYLQIQEEISKQSMLIKFIMSLCLFSFFFLVQ